MSQRGTITPQFDGVLSEMRAVSTRMLLRRQHQDVLPIDGPDAPTEAQDTASESDQAQDGERLRDLFATLDGWLCLGGYLPKDWDDAHKASKGQKHARRPDKVIAKHLERFG